MKGRRLFENTTTVPQEPEELIANAMICRAFGLPTCINEIMPASSFDQEGWRCSVWLSIETTSPLPWKTTLLGKQVGEERQPLVLMLG